MPSLTLKKIIMIVLVLIILGGGIFAAIYFSKKPVPPVTPPVIVDTTQPVRTVIGKSVEGREIESLTFGDGETHLAFVGGIHGGYEWNSVLLAYQFIDHLKANPSAIPENMKISVIPSANPDGVFKVIKKEGRFTTADVPADDGAVAGTGRFNANGVDLNRNFDCKWKPESTWRSQTVSAGTAPFSEPEAKAIQNFVNTTSPDAVVFWHSQADAVYASECENGILPGTLALMNAYAGATGYKAVDSFDAYPVSGDAEGWLASIGIPAITVELKTHETVEWEKNLLGVKALFAHYGTGSNLGR